MQVRLPSFGAYDTRSYPCVTVRKRRRGALDAVLVSCLGHYLPGAVVAHSTDRITPA